MNQAAPYACASASEPVQLRAAVRGTDLAHFFEFLRERYRILLRRRGGKPWPWTDDRVLRAYHFPNVFREDDPTTVAFRETVRDPLRDDPHVIRATIAWRWFNRIESGEVLRPFLMSLEEWNRPEIERRLEDRLGAGERVFSRAFMVHSEPNRPKVRAVLDYIDWCFSHMDLDELARSASKKRSLFRRLAALPRLGDVLANQIITDLEQTRWLAEADDLDEFTAVGPGCSAALGLCFYGRANHFTYEGTAAQRPEMLDLLLQVHDEARKAGKWPKQWPQLSLSDIKNGLSSFERYLSLTKEGNQRRQRRYRPAA